MPSVGPVHDLLGRTFGDLTVVSYIAGTKSVRAKWLCWCACGNIRKNSTNQLTGGRSLSCGCTKYARIGAKKKTHGHTVGSEHTRTYRIWTNMKTRCDNKNASNYKFYGGRGISYSPSWRDFSAFLRDMGDCPQSMTLDRIDTDGSYSKENCRWASWTEQASNKTNNRMVEILGSTMTMSQAARKYGMSVGTVWQRLKYGWTPSQAVGLEPRPSARLR